MVAVAQLVESRIVIPVVVGSSPISHPSRMIKEPEESGSLSFPRFFVFQEVAFMLPAFLSAEQ